jgi:hypothetical protein
MLTDSQFVSPRGRKCASMEAKNEGGPEKLSTLQLASSLEGRNESGLRLYISFSGKYMNDADSNKFYGNL